MLHIRAPFARNLFNQLTIWHFAIKIILDFRFKQYNKFSFYANLITGYVVWKVFFGRILNTILDCKSNSVFLYIPVSITLFYSFSASSIYLPPIYLFLCYFNSIIYFCNDPNSWKILQNLLYLLFYFCDSIYRRTCFRWNCTLSYISPPQ